MKTRTGVQMTAAELIENMNLLGMTTGELCSLFDVSPVTVWRWQDGRYPVPKYVAVFFVCYDALDRRSRKAVRTFLSGGDDPAAYERTQ